MDICTLSEFATDQVIIRILAKERGKLAAKSSGHTDIFRPGKPGNRLAEMMPPRKDWVRPSKSKRPAHTDKGLGKWTCRRKSATRSVQYTILREIRKNPDTEWVRNLRAFAEEVREILEGRKDYRLESPRIIAKFKKDDGDRHIYRPICCYSDLMTKVLLTVSCQYILHMFDRMFHSGMVFMRGARKNNDNTWSTPDFRDCVTRAMNFRENHDGETIWVGECDIQKFYDIFNHDKIRDCFEILFSGFTHGGDTSVFDQLRRIIDAYLDSYDFPGNVLELNNDPDFWKKENCCFDWVSREEFIRSGAYGSEEELDAAIRERKIGIPQGGMLSGIIVNVVMNVVDNDIIKDKDPGRFFVRYCDDILLMHTDRSRCEEYLNIYRSNLTDQKLIYHPFHNVAAGKRGRKINHGFWKAKSKDVFLWGRDDENSSDWLAFVGYELRRTGEIRLRKDKIDGEYSKIARAYHKMKGGNASQFTSIASSMKDYELLHSNRYSMNQARRLDKYLFLKTRQAVKAKAGIRKEDVRPFTEIVRTLKTKLPERGI